MNERMTELYAKACLDARDIHPTDVPAFIACMAEKFAELIVKECSMLVEGFEITQEVALDEYVDYEASAVLKEHFGVEL